MKLNIKHGLLIFLSILFTSHISASEVDTVAVSISANIVSPTNQTKITTRLTFETEVNDFMIDHIKSENALISNLRIGNNYRLDWTFDVVPILQGEVKIWVPAHMTSVFPEGDYWNMASDTFSFYYDNSRPRITLSSDENSPTNAANYWVNIRFSEVVNGFQSNHIAVTNGAKSNFEETETNRQYKINISPVADGMVSVSVPAAVVTDEAGNTNTASDALQHYFDLTAPKVSLWHESDSLVNTDSVLVYVEFSEKVDTLALSYFLTENAALKHLRGVVPDKKWRFHVFPQQDGYFNLHLPADSVQDLVGNTNAESVLLEWWLDKTRPTVSIENHNQSPTKQDTLLFNIAASEVLYGFGGSDIQLFNANLHSFSQTSEQLWTCVVVAKSSGMTGISVPQGVAGDLAGNLNLAGDTHLVEVDKDRPVCIISSSEINPTNEDKFRAVIEFNETINGLELSDFVTTNATADDLQELEFGLRYEFYISPLSDGRLVVNLKDSSVIDHVGNPGLISNFYDIVSDRTPPQLTIVSPDGSTVHSQFEIRFQTNEASSGMLDTSVTVTNGTLSDFYDSGGGFEWTATIIPGEIGNITISVGQNAVVDHAGNYSGSVEPLTIMFNDDLTRPDVVLSSDVTSPTNSTAILVDIAFSEPVVGFNANMIDITNCYLSGFTQVAANQAWQVYLMPLNDGTVSARIQENLVADESGNYNRISNKPEWEVDLTPPVVTATISTNGPDNDPLFVVRFDISEAITDFTNEDLRVENCTMLSFEKSSSSRYTGEFQATNEGIAKVFVAQDGIFDLSGNSNAKSNEVSFTYDASEPIPVLSHQYPSDSITFSPFDLLVNFNEKVVSFNFQEITVVNATLTNYDIVEQGWTYSLTLAPITEDYVYVRVDYGAAYDEAGNQSKSSAQLNMYYYTESDDDDDDNEDTAVPKVESNHIKAWYADGFLILENRKNLLNPVKIRIFSTSGKLLYFDKFPASAKISIPLTLKTGAYWLQVSEHNQMYSKKIIVR